MKRPSCPAYLRANGQSAREEVGALEHAAAQVAAGDGRVRGLHGLVLARAARVVRRVAERHREAAELTRVPASERSKRA